MFFSKTLCSCVEMLSFVYSAIISASKILAADTRGFDVCFSSLPVVKDDPREAAVQEDPSLLLEDSGIPKGKIH